VVDDEKDMTRLLQRTLEPELNYRVTMAFSGEMALNILGLGDTPFEQDKIIFKIRKALERSRLISENRRLQKACRNESLPLIGQSPAMRKVFEKIAPMHAAA